MKKEGKDGGSTISIAQGSTDPDGWGGSSPAGRRNTPLARILIALNTLSPALTAALAQFGNGMLPAPAGPHGNARRSGWESRSAAAPPLFTRLADNAVERNNEG